MNFQIYVFFSAYFFCKILEYPEKGNAYKRSCIVFSFYFISIAIFFAITQILKL